MGSSGGSGGGSCGVRWKLRQEFHQGLWGPAPMTLSTLWFGPALSCCPPCHCLPYVCWNWNSPCAVPRTRRTEGRGHRVGTKTWCSGEDSSGSHPPASLQGTWESVPSWELWVTCPVEGVCPIRKQTGELRAHCCSLVPISVLQNKVQRMKSSPCKGQKHSRCPGVAARDRGESDIA